MPQFAFIAKDQLGNTVQGTLEAQDAASAANRIGQMSYTLVELTPEASPLGRVAASGTAASPATPFPAETTAAFPAPRSFRSPAADANRTQAMTPGSVSPSANPADRTVGLPGSANRSAPAGPPTAAPGTPPSTAAGPAADILQADIARRRKVEMDLARMGMKPDEIKRLLDANASTFEPSPTDAAPYLVPGAMPPSALAPRNPKQAAQQKLAARAADLQSFAAQLQSSTAAARVQAVEAVTLDLPEFRASTNQERQQAEALLREVYALRKREKYAEALAKCREALTLVPSDAAALEMFGDLLQGVARTNEAMAAYKRATEADPKRASAERKYGDLLVRQQQWSEADPEEVPKNPIAAAAFSLLLPGAGQLHTGQRMKGIVLLACAAISMAALLFLMRDETPYDVSSAKKPMPKTTAAREKPAPVDWTAQAPVIACVGFYTLLSLGSAIDAAKFAQRTRG